MTRIDDYLKEVGRHLAAPKTDRQRILDELRSHLEDQIADATRAAGDDADHEAIARGVLRDFGEPRELALSYEPERAVIRDATGTVALQVTRDVAKGTGRVLKFTVLTVLISAGVLLAVGGFVLVGLSAFLADDIRDAIETHAPEPVYMHDHNCPEPCMGALDAESFFVHANAREVRFSINVVPAEGNAAEANQGTLRIVVTDPSGDVRYDRTFGADDAQQNSHLTWGPETGDWTVTYDHTLWKGQVSIDGWTVGLGS